MTLLLVFVLNIGTSTAHEGMWMLNMIQKLNMSEMESLGLKLTADEIYNINNSSLKDAIARLNYGSCTAEMISANGLTLTNHHCAYGAIQSHSTVEKDYLTDGFMAKTLGEELPVEGMVVSYLKRVEDVSDVFNAQLKDDMEPKERQKMIRQIMATLEGEMSEEGKYDVDVKAFFEGNEFYAMIYTTYTDVRLVGAPPSSIGKFGGDTDNWMWPRHTGDFSLLRVYADGNGMPAAYSESNKPYNPSHHLPVSLDGVKENDFAMVLGYPGSTDRYLSSHGVKQAIEIEQPARVEVRGEKLRLMKEDMDADPAVRIKYAAKYAQVSNYWKYFQGQMRGLKKLKVYDKKVDIENQFNSWANGDATRKAKYGEAIQMLKDGYATLDKYAKADAYLQEAAFGSEAFLLSYRATALAAALEVDDKESIDGGVMALKGRASGHWKDYNVGTDKKLTARMLEMYYNNIDKEFHPEFLAKAAKGGKFKAYVEKMFAKSIFASETKLNAFMEAPSLKVLQKDPVYTAFNQFLNVYRSKIGAAGGPAYDKIDNGYRLMVAGLREMNPKKNYYPNANSTMRLTYGIVDDYIPADGMLYDFETTTRGIIEKENPNDEEFMVPSRLKELIMAKDFGAYGNEDGELIVCFLTNTDITGGNSGSPVINGKGELIGLAFDGNWEAMSGDIAFEPELQRTISVDIRYVLFIIDKYYGAKHIIEELDLVKSPSKTARKEAKALAPGEMVNPGMN